MRLTVSVCVGNCFLSIDRNIDGLMEATSSLAQRTKAVIQTILNMKPSVVFLQEVIQESEVGNSSFCVALKDLLFCFLLSRPLFVAI